MSKIKKVAVVLIVLLTLYNVFICDWSNVADEYKVIYIILLVGIIFSDLDIKIEIKGRDKDGK